RDVEKIRAIYSVANENIGEDASLLQQESIFEMSAHGGNLEKADSLLKKAHLLEPKNGLIAHSKAEFLLRKAQKTSQPLMINKLISSAKEICAEIVGNKRNKNIVHGYHTHLKILLYELKILFDNGPQETIERKIQEFEKTINKVMQNYPKESFLLDAESSFNK